MFRPLLDDGVTMDNTGTGTRPSPLKSGRYCELSATHLSVATTCLLDRWATGVSSCAPLFVAVNMRGWFVSTSSIDAVSDVPDDLMAALHFGRERGFAFLFFHCDADPSASLPLCDW